MAHNKYPFTNKEIRELEANKYVKHVSAESISFTNEFREYFVKRYNEGVRTPQIFAECGFDVNVLGRARMHAYRARTVGSVAGYKQNKINELQIQVNDLKKRVEQLENVVNHITRFGTV